MNTAIVERAGRTASAARKRTLAIGLAHGITAPPTASHRLLVAFRFGAARDGAAADGGPGPILSTGLTPIDGRDAYECWWYEGAITRRNTDDIAIAECDDYVVACLQRPDAPPDRMRELTYRSYVDLLAAIGTTGHRRLAKIWNYFPDINDGDGDGEKYRQFSIGRAEAFEKAGILDSSVPCGTAVGAPSGGKLSVIALATKHDFVATENPRQVSAYVYPRQYGPRSPKFSRAGCVGNGNHRLFVLSGTAAIVGHESAHPFQTARQIDETLENLAHLSRALTPHSRDVPAFALDRGGMLRVYLRDPGDYELVAARLAAAAGSNPANAVFLHADICRRELMVEIDGIGVG